MEIRDVFKLHQKLNLFRFRRFRRRFLCRALLAPSQNFLHVLLREFLRIVFFLVRRYRRPSIGLPRDRVSGPDAATQSDHHRRASRFWFSIILSVIVARFFFFTLLLSFFFLLREDFRRLFPQHLTPKLLLSFRFHRISSSTVLRKQFVAGHERRFHLSPALRLRRDVRIVQIFRRL